MPFDSIKGHVRQIRLLRSAVRRGTVAHAYLFTGIPGIGKMTVARSLAKTLNCSAGGDADFCDACPSCVMINGGTHPDVQSIEPDGDFIKITQIRTMQDRMLYTRFLDRYRLVLLDHAEAMNLQSANCLLKTLEEPPGNTVIILLTPLPYRIPATIRSRCQRVAFHPLSSRQIEESLRELRGPDAGDTCLLASRLAGGSLGRALRWQESGMLKQRQRLLSLIARPEPSLLNAVFDVADELGEDRKCLLELLDLLRLWIRDVMIAKDGGAPVELLNTDLADEAMSMAGSISWPQLFQQDLLVAEVHAALQGPVNPKLAMEHLMLTLTPAPPVRAARPAMNHRAMHTH
jgi:DNA polymerase-3 subunit delta'